LNRKEPFKGGVYLKKVKNQSEMAGSSFFSEDKYVSLWLNFK
jgi:hypothetical protein